MLSFLYFGYVKKYILKTNKKVRKNAKIRKKWATNAKITLFCQYLLKKARK